MSELLHEDDDQPPLYAEICQYYFRQITDGSLQADLSRQLTKSPRNMGPASRRHVAG